MVDLYDSRSFFQNCHFHQQICATNDHFRSVGVSQRPFEKYERNNSQLFCYINLFSYDGLSNTIRLKRGLDREEMCSNDDLSCTVTVKVCLELCPPVVNKMSGNMFEIYSNHV